MDEKKIKYCKNCLMPSTRPRITFNDEGICNGCEWTEKKTKEVDWKARWKELENLCDKYRCKDGTNWDIIIPCSGGKDSYHIAWNMKYKLKMHPLLVRVSPLIPTKVGERNWRHLAELGFDCIQITPDLKTYAALHKRDIFEEGRAWTAFESAITTAVLKIAISFKIPFVMYGEEGESEYGGKINMQNKTGCKREWIVDTYFSGQDTNKYKGQFKKEKLKWWQFPVQEELDKQGIFYAHWSFFEDWNHLLHFETAKKMGFQTAKAHSTRDGVAGFGTYNDYICLDDPYTRQVNTYLMFLKFGFGRGSQEATGDIKIGKMTREEGIKMAEKYDPYDGYHFRDKVLKFYGMTPEEWDIMVDKWANRDILKKVNGQWVLKEPIPQ